MSEWQDTAALGPESLFEACEMVRALSPRTASVIMDRDEGTPLRVSGIRLGISGGRANDIWSDGWKQLRSLLAESFVTDAEVEMRGRYGTGGYVNGRKVSRKEWKAFQDSYVGEKVVSRLTLDDYRRWDAEKKR